MTWQLPILPSSIKSQTQNILNKDLKRIYTKLTDSNKLFKLISLNNN